MGRSGERGQADVQGRTCPALYPITGTLVLFVSWLLTPPPGPNLYLRSLAALNASSPQLLAWVPHHGHAFAILSKPGQIPCAGGSQPLCFLFTGHTITVIVWLLCGSLNTVSSRTVAGILFCHHCIHSESTEPGTRHVLNKQLQLVKEMALVQAESAQA